MLDLETAKNTLRETGCTCVLVRGSQIITRTERGIRPLMQLLEAGADCQGFSAADKVIGKATAFLYAKLGVRQVYAPIISRSAVEVLTGQQIAFSYDLCVDAILNRQKDGFCPMESAVRDISDPEQAWQALRIRYRQMNPGTKTGA